MIIPYNTFQVRTWSWQTGYLGFHHAQKLEIRGATERDPIHSTLYRITLNGWLENFRSVPHIACHFWGYHYQFGYPQNCKIGPSMTSTVGT